VTQDGSTTSVTDRVSVQGERRAPRRAARAGSQRRAPGNPHRVLAAMGLGELVAAELGRQPGLNPIPPIDEIVPGEEAEVIFDLFVESFA
jgi:hypothetical protein